MIDMWTALQYFWRRWALRITNRFTYFKTWRWWNSRLQWHIYCHWKYIRQHWQIQGALLACTPPNRIQFIPFHIHFRWKVCIWGRCPPNGLAPPQWEILDLQLAKILDNIFCKPHDKWDANKYDLILKPGDIYDPNTIVRIEVGDTVLSVKLWG